MLKDGPVKSGEILLALIEIPYKNWNEKLELVFESSDIHLALAGFVNKRRWNMIRTRKTETGRGTLQFKKRMEETVKVACKHAPVDSISCSIQAQGIMLWEDRWIDLHKATSEVISSISKKVAYRQNAAKLFVLEKSD